jgi:hypothetical protein
MRPWFRRPDLGRQLDWQLRLPGCGFGHRVGDVPVPRRSSTGAVTIAADRTSGAPRSGIREKEIGDVAPRRAIAIGVLRPANLKLATDRHVRA